MQFEFMALFIALPIALLGIFGAFVLRATAQRRPEAYVERVERSTWVLTFALALIFLMASLPKLSGSVDAVNAFDRWGIPTSFVFWVGAVEFFGAIMLLVPRLTSAVAVLMSLLMSASLVTHVLHGEWMLALLPLLCIAGLLRLAYVRRHTFMASFTNNHGGRNEREAQSHSADVDHNVNPHTNQRGNPRSVSEL